MKGYASFWWENLKGKRSREERRPIMTWERMKLKLKKGFLPKNYIQNNYIKFYNFKQYSLYEEYITIV